MVVNAAQNIARKNLLDITAAPNPLKKGNCVQKFYTNIAQYRENKLGFGYDQEDATEFLFDALEILNGDNSPIQEESKLEAHKSVFRGKSYKQKKPQIEPAHYLNLPIVGNSVSSALKSYMTKERLGDSELVEFFQGSHNAIEGRYESGPKKKLPTFKTITPQIKDDAKEIVVALKRIDFDFSTRTQTKNAADVHCDDINLKTVSGKNVALKATSYIIHKGSHHGNGHYITVNQECDAQGNIHYYKYDDDGCQKVQGNELEKLKKQAYAVKYSVVHDGKVELPKREVHSGAENKGNTCWANAATAFLTSFTSFEGNYQSVGNAHKKVEPVDYVVNSYAVKGEKSQTSEAKTSETKMVKSKVKEPAKSTVLENVDWNALWAKKTGIVAEVQKPVKAPVHKDKHHQARAAEAKVEAQPKAQPKVQPKVQETEKSGKAALDNIDWDALWAKKKTGVAAKKQPVQAPVKINSFARDAEAKVEAQLNVRLKAEPKVLEKSGKGVLDTIDWDALWAKKESRKVQGPKHDAQTVTALKKYVVITQGLTDKDFDGPADALALKVWNNPKMTDLDREKFVALYNKHHSSDQINSSDVKGHASVDDSDVINKVKKIMDAMGDDAKHYEPSMTVTDMKAAQLSRSAESLEI